MWTCIIAGVAGFALGFVLGAFLVTKGLVLLLAAAKRKGRLHIT
jgi:hypothetical protein